MYKLLDTMNYIFCSAVYLVRLREAEEHFVMKKTAKHHLTMKKLIQQPQPLEQNIADDPFVARVFSTFQTEVNKLDSIIFVCTYCRESGNKILAHA